MKKSHRRSKGALQRLIGAFIALSVVILLTPPTFARTYYVATSENASNENTGGTSDPLRSIGLAISLAEPGDVVSVRPGDFRDEDNGYGIGVIPVLNSGSQEQPIRIRTNRKSQNSRAIVHKFLVQNCHDLIIEGFNFRGTDFSSLQDWQPMPVIVRQSIEGTERPDFTLAYETRQEQIESEFSTYFQQVERLGFESGIDLENSSSVRVFENQIAGYFAGIQCRGCQNIDILKNTIRECFNGIFTFLPDRSDAPGLVRSSIRLNEISQCLDNGIDIRAASQAVVIKDNRVCFSGRSHISLQDGATQCNVRSNILGGGGYYSETMIFPGSSGISLNNAGEWNLVSENLIQGQVDFTGIDGNGIIVDFMPEGSRTYIHKNTSMTNMGAGLNLTASPGTRVTRNLFALNGLGATERRRGSGIKISRDEDVDNLIFGNVFALNRVAGILSSDNIEKQKLINRNFYVSDGKPLIWDGFNNNEREYCSLQEVRLLTGWERHGEEISISTKEDSN